MRTRGFLFLFIPALTVALFGLFVQIVQYKPLIPKETAPSDAAFTIPLYDDDPILGDRRAPITLIAFEDFGCEPCRTQMKLLQTLMTQYPKKVKVIWKGLPITRIPVSSERAHAFGYCAHEQKKFADFESDLLSRNDLSDETLFSVAGDAKLNTNDLTSCLNSTRPQTYQAKTETLAQALTLQAVPVIFLNNKQIQAPTSLEGWITFLHL